MTRRILQAVPEVQCWLPMSLRNLRRLGKPRHARGNAAQLRQHDSARLPAIDMDDPSHYWPDQTWATRDAALAAFDANAADCRAALASLADDSQPSPGSSPSATASSPTAPVARLPAHVLFNHLIHHRAQYLASTSARNDVLVPGVYGPSADERPSLPRRGAGPQLLGRPDRGYLRSVSIIQWAL